MSFPILEVRDLVKHYPAVTAVDGISFACPRGSASACLGPTAPARPPPSRSWRASFAPTSGEVFYSGEPVGRRFREEAGILFQKTALQDFLTLRQSLNLFRGLYSQGHGGG